MLTISSCSRLDSAPQRADHSVRRPVGLASASKMLRFGVLFVGLTATLFKDRERQTYPIFSFLLFRTPQTPKDVQSARCPAAMLMLVKPAISQPITPIAKAIGKVLSARQASQRKTSFSRRTPMACGQATPIHDEGLCRIQTRAMNPVPEPFIDSSSSPPFQEAP